jgi:predicted RNA-binding Zn-ribbon protein involved in translation (DUF1610 family)
MCFGDRLNPQSVAVSHNFDAVASEILYSKFTCPTYGLSRRESMPANARQLFYECEDCGELLKPLSGDC